MSERSLEFAFWNVHQDTVRDNVSRFTADTGIAVMSSVIDGSYHETLSESLTSGYGAHVFYAQRAEASDWSHRGLIEPMDESDPRLAPSLSRMDRRLLDGARGTEGELLGLTYYNGGPFCLFFRDASQATPESWMGLLELCRQARRDGVAEHPFVPRWHRGQTGLMWSVLCHLATEGVLELTDDAAEQALIGMIGIYRSLVRECLVPPDSLAHQDDRAALRQWASGRHVVTFTTDYLAADACALSGRPISVPADGLPGRTGTPLMPGHALLCVRAGLDRGRRREATALAAYLGGATGEGKLEVHRRWLTSHLFAVPYPELSDDPAIARRLARFFPPGEGHVAVERMRDNRRRAVVSPPTHASGMLAWSARADRILRAALIAADAAPADEAAQQVLREWRALQHECR